MSTLTTSPFRQQRTTPSSTHLHAQAKPWKQEPYAASHSGQAHVNTVHMTGPDSDAKRQAPRVISRASARAAWRPQHKVSSSEGQANVIWTYRAQPASRTIPLRTFLKRAGLLPPSVRPSLLLAEVEIAPAPMMHKYQLDQHSALHSTARFAVLV